MWWMWNSKKIEQAKIEEERRRKLNYAQARLLEACTTSADAASNVIATLKKRLDDTIKQFDTTMKIINDALIVADDSGKVIAVNPSMESMFSCRSSDIVSKNIKSLFQMQSSDAWKEIHSDSTTGIRMNGETFPVNIKTETMMKSDGSNLHLVLVVDLSTHNQLKRTSKELEHRYSVLFDQCIDGIVILQNGVIVASNDTARNILHDNMSIKIDHGGNIELNNPNGELEYIISGTNITWNDQDASLITIKDIRGLVPMDSSKFPLGVSMIVCFTPDYLITYANEPFASYYNSTRSALLNTDVRKIMSQTELASFMVSINSLTKESPMKRIQLHVNRDDVSVIQNWIDYASFENDVVSEYQRTGQDTTNALNDIISK